jgi:DNA-binding transcriptional LysR family regulator
MNLAQIRAFHAVAMHNGFSAAAQALGVSQPAVTQHIKALEDSFGTRLFSRGGGGVELTGEGRDLLPLVHRAVMMLDDLGARIGDGRRLVGHPASASARSCGDADPEGFDPASGRVDMRLDNSSRLLDPVAANWLNSAVATPLEPDGPLCEPLVEQRVLALVPMGHPGGRGSRSRCASSRARLLSCASRAR